MKKDNVEMTFDLACKWVDDRMMYGRYKPSMRNQFVLDECCQAGMLAIKSLRTVENMIALLTERIDSGYYSSDEQVLVAKDLLDQLKAKVTLDV